MLAVYSASRNRKGIRIELAIRDWARRDPRAAAVVEEVDAARFDCARRLFVARGMSEQEAAARSILLYAYVFGQSLMDCDRFEADLPLARRDIFALIRRLACDRAGESARRGEARFSHWPSSRLQDCPSRQNLAKPASTAAMRGRLPGSLRPPAANSGGMSGPSVSSTIASSGSLVACSRILERARIGQRATEPQLEAKPDERVGLLATAIERVGDTTRHRNPPQMLEYRVLGAPDVQQHRQLVFAGQLELFGEKPLLPYPIVAVNEKVEPDLADRYGASERKLRIQFRDIAVLGTIDDHRVNAQRMVAPRVAKIEIGDDAEVLASDCRNDDLADAGVARGLHDSITIGRVFRGVEMTVSVDELHDFGARRQPGYFALRRLTKASIPCNVASSIMLQAIDSLAS